MGKGIKVNFILRSCVESQPGLIQLLIGVKNNVNVVRSAVPVTESADNESVVDLVVENGCLATMLDLLKETLARAESDPLPQNYLLHVALVGSLE